MNNKELKELKELKDSIFVAICCGVSGLIIILLLMACYAKHDNYIIYVARAFYAKHAHCIVYVARALSTILFCIGLFSINKLLDIDKLHHPAILLSIIAITFCIFYPINWAIHIAVLTFIFILYCFLIDIYDDFYCNFFQKEDE